MSQPPELRDDRPVHIPDGVEVIRDDDAYVVAFERGESDRLVIAFAGFRHEFGGIERLEFSRSLRDQAVRNSVCYVIDRGRTWYNAATDELASTLDRLGEQHREVVTLGNSMGGFAAIYFAGRIARCRRAIAFGPRFSIAPGVIPADDRHEEHVGSIASRSMENAVESGGAHIEYRLIYGANEPRDRLHREAYERHGPTTLRTYVVPRSGHAVARHLRADGFLGPLLDVALNGDAGPAAILGRLPPGTREGRGRSTAFRAEPRPIDRVAGRFRGRSRMPSAVADQSGE